MTKENFPKEELGMTANLRSTGWKKIKARYRGVCEVCGDRFDAGIEIFWKREEDAEGLSRTHTICVNCFMEARTDGQE